MDYMEKYNLWINSSTIDEATKDELKEIKNDKDEIEDRFYKDLEFGTGGLRGVMGAGTNRLNIYTVRRATQGLANYIIDQGQEAVKAGAVIAYDSRNNSDKFALEAALVLCANGIKTYLYSELQPTPILSFSVRHLKAAAGIVITASHNPPKYNGYKVYGSDGGQVVPHTAKKIIAKVNEINDFDSVKIISKEQAQKDGLLIGISNEVVDEYIKNVKNLCTKLDMTLSQGDKLKVVYTPLHGSGNVPVRRVLKTIGVSNVELVQEQVKPDGDFPTVSYPNPEDPAAFELAFKLAEEKDADIIIATDPDSDRVGAAVRKADGKFGVLTGNQTGALLVNYYISSLKEKGMLPNNSMLVKTIVTSEMGGKIAESFGVNTVDTLTGFKFIGEKMKEYEQSGEYEYVFGYEESYGYLAGNFVRDKDAVIASMLICEMALYYKLQNKNLYNALEDIWNNYGHYAEALESIKMEGIEGMRKIKKLMSGLREEPISSVANLKVTAVEDYLNSKAITADNEIKTLDLPPSNVLKYRLEDESWFCIRPSGTEPKVKVYFSAVGKNKEDAWRNIESVKQAVMCKIKAIV